MKPIAVPPFARLKLYATLAQFTLACGGDGGHGPPTGPIGPIISEGGNSSSGASTGGASVGAVPDGMSGGVLSVAGITNRDPSGTGGDGSAGRDPFGSGGSGTGSDRSGSAGTPSPFGGASSF